MIWIKIYALSIIVSAVIAYLCSMEMLQKLEVEGRLEKGSSRKPGSFLGVHIILTLFVPVLNLLVAGTFVLSLDRIYAAVKGENES